jgi:hypothetical protein
LDNRLSQSVVLEVEIPLHASESASNKHLALFLADALVLIGMEVNREPFSRALIIKAWYPANLSFSFGSSTCIAFYCSNALDFHPLSMLHQVFNSCRTCIT